jgi:hypothetical protein
MVDDPRSAQGRIHELAFVLAGAVVATLAGAKNFAEAGRKAADLSQELLKKLGAEWEVVRKPIRPAFQWKLRLTAGANPPPARFSTPARSIKLPTILQ